MLFLIVLGILIVIAVLFFVVKNKTTQFLESPFVKLIILLLVLLILAGISCIAFPGAVILVKVIFAILLICIAIKLVLFLFFRN